MNKFAKVDNQGTSLNIALLHYRRWSSYVKQEEGQFVLLTFSHCTLISEESCWVGWQFVRERLRVASFWEPSRQHEARKWCIFPLPQWAECIDFSLALVLPLFQSCTLTPKISQYKLIITLQIYNIYWGQVCGKDKSEACNDIINTPLLPLKWQNHKQSSLLLCIHSNMFMIAIFIICEFRKWNWYTSKCFFRE